MLNQQIIEAIKFFINTLGFHATRLAIEKYWEELTDPEARKLLKAQLPRHEQSSAEYHVIESRLHATERCTSDGIDSVFSGYELATESILSLLNANTWDEISNALKTEKHHLLPEVSDVAFADLVMQPSPDKERLHILVGWNLIKMCRALNIEEAISQYRALDIKGAGEEPVRALRIGQFPDGQWGIDVEKSGEELVRPKRWLPILSPDSLDFLYLTSIHSTEEYQQYEPLVQSLKQHYGLGSTRLVIEKYWNELMLPKVCEVLAYKLLPRRYELPSPEQRVAEARLHAIERCMSDGIDFVFSGYELATQSVLLLLNANDWDEVREVVESNRHNLLPEVADIAFADLVMQPSPDDVQNHILGGWNLIRQCRELGVEAAFEEQSQEKHGTIYKPQSQEFSKLASANSLEELQQGLAALDPFRRRREGQAQAQMWDGFENYQTTMSALAAPKDLPKRIEICRAALGELDRAKVPLIWAMVSLDLADSLLKQLQQQTAPDMTKVISLYQDALTILTPKGEPDQFGHAHHYLGDAYLLHGKGDPAENIEKAIGNYQKALGMRRPKVEPIPWATTMAYLGEALNRRLRDDRTINLDRAVVILEHAIEVLKGSNEKVLLGAAYVSLGVALTERITGSPAENLNRAVEKFNLAIETVEPSSPTHIQVLVGAHGNLGALFWKKAHSALWNYSALLEQAETHFRLALDRVGAETSPLVQARLHMGLGLVLSDRINAGSELHEGAIHHSEEAIRLLKEEKTTSAGDLGLAYHNLANIYLERKSDDRKTNIESVESYFLSALDAFSTHNFPVQRRDTLRAFGMMYFQEEEWGKADTRFQEAIQISEEILGGCYTEPGKEAEVTKNRTLYNHAVYCLLKLKRFAEALDTLEQGKARMLNEALEWKDMDVSTLSKEQQQALQWTRDEIVRLETKSRLPQASLGTEHQARLGRQLADAYRHLAKLRSEASNLSIGELDLRTILEEIPTNGALVVPIVTPKGGAAFVLPDGLDSLSEKHVVPLGSLTVSVLGELMAGRAGSGGWLNIYADWVKGAFVLADGILQKELDRLASRLWDILMGPIYKRLNEFGVAEQAPVVIIPSGWLGLFPLHAACGITDGQRRTFSEDFTVSYAPSVRILRICRQRLAQSQRQGKKLLAIANPTTDLQFAEAECSALSDLFIQWQRSLESAVILPRNKATRTNVVRELKGTNYHHFSCHGQFHWTNPAGSGLKLAEDNWLYLPDILSFDVDLSTSRLVSLSACETGLSEFRDMPDEFIGLPGAFLEGGAPAVVSTLWRVDEVSTRFLMAEFYRLHLNGQSVATALRAAQMCLRTSSASQLGLAEEYQRIFTASEQTDFYAKDKWDYYKEHPDDLPFEHPFYWAAFTLTGAY